MKNDLKKRKNKVAIFTIFIVNIPKWRYNNDVRK